MTAAAIEPQTAAATRASGSSFYFAMRILPAAQRDAMFEIYSFCRAVDDIADGDLPRAQRSAVLAHWRRDFDALYAGVLPPALASLAGAEKAFGMRKDDILVVIDGKEMDAVEDIRAPSFDKLDLYCDRVASAVGRLSVRVFGMEEANGIALAHHLGRALQLTNILRAVAGPAGPAAAVRLTAQGRRAAAHEATGQPGGRCRSYYDHVTGMVIDNGSHLLLSGNHAARDYLKAIGAEHLLEGPPSAEFDFIDLPTLKRWTVRFNDGQIPWWIFDKNRRVPDTKARDYLGLMRLMFMSGDKPLSELVRCEGPLYERLLEPLFLAALNIEPLHGSGKLAGQIVRETLALGGQACRPLIAPGGIGDAFIAPALRTLREQGVEVALQHPLLKLELEDDRVRALDFGEETIVLGEGDRVILAVPAFIATAMVPGLSAPTAFRSIVNAHFRIATPAGAPRMIGVVTGTAEWIFALPGRVAVTVSDAGELVDATS